MGYSIFASSNKESLERLNEILKELDNENSNMRITDQCDQLGRLNYSELQKYNYGEKKQSILSYMKQRIFAITASSARVFDFVEGCKNSSYCRIDFSDGSYLWSANDILYIEKYDMKVKPDFIKHVFKAIYNSPEYKAFLERVSAPPYPIKITEEELQIVREKRLADKNKD